MREVHAIRARPGPAFTQLVAAALAGDGPAILPLSPGLPDTAVKAALETLRPTHADGERYPGGIGTDAAVVITTSGTTGEPKGVELSAGALRASARASLRRLGATARDRWLCCLPVSHVAGLQVLARAIVAGSEPITHERFDARAVLDEAPVHVSLVPTQLRRLLDLGAPLDGLSVVLGGAAIPPGLVKEARTAGARVVRTYGMSETCGGCVYDGVPLDGVRVSIDEESRINLAGPVLFDGYRFGPRTGTWFRTSDLGELDGDRLRVLGRADDVITSGGVKVVPVAVERVLSEHPAVREVVVAGRPDPDWGERVTAFVVPEGAPPTLGELRELALGRLPAAAAPRALEVVESIPALPSGKPDRRFLGRMRKILNRMEPDGGADAS